MNLVLAVRYAEGAETRPRPSIVLMICFIISISECLNISLTGVMRGEHQKRKPERKNNGGKSTRKKILSSRHSNILCIPGR